jgi:hypothetical protein
MVFVYEEAALPGTCRRSFDRPQLLGLLDEWCVCRLQIGAIGASFRDRIYRARSLQRHSSMGSMAGRPGGRASVLMLNLN